MAQIAAAPAKLPISANQCQSTMAGDEVGAAAAPSGRPRERRRASLQRIKLSRELMVRLSAALGDRCKRQQQQQQQQLAAGDRNDNDRISRLAGDAIEPPMRKADEQRQLANHYAAAARFESKSDICNGDICKRDSSAASSLLLLAPTSAFASALAKSNNKEDNSQLVSPRRGSRFEPCAPLKDCSIVGVPADESRYRNKWQSDRRQRLAGAQIGANNSPERHLRNSKQSSQSHNKGQQLGQAGGHHKSCSLQLKPITSSGHTAATAAVSHSNFDSDFHRPTHRKGCDRQTQRLARLACCKKPAEGLRSKSRSVVSRRQRRRRRLRRCSTLIRKQVASRRLSRDDSARSALPRRNGFHASCLWLYNRNNSNNNKRQVLFNEGRRHMWKRSCSSSGGSRSGFLFGYSGCHRLTRCKRPTELRPRRNRLSKNWWPTVEEARRRGDERTYSTCRHDITGCKLAHSNLPIERESFQTTNGGQDKICLVSSFRQTNSELLEGTPLLVGRESTANRRHAAISINNDRLVDEQIAAHAIRNDNSYHCLIKSNREPRRSVTNIGLGGSLSARNTDATQTIDRRTSTDEKQAINEKSSVILEPPLKRITHNLAFNSQIGSNVAAGSADVLSFAHAQSAAAKVPPGLSCQHHIHLQNIQQQQQQQQQQGQQRENKRGVSHPAKDCKRRKRRRKRSKSSGSGSGSRSQRSNQLTARPCDRPKPLAWLAKQGMVAASQCWPASPTSTCWKTLIWALIGAVLLALLQPVGQVGRVSGLEQAMPATLASDEFRDTVLATMSTQSPINAEEPPPPKMNNSSMKMNDNLLDETAALAQEPPDWLERVLTFCRIFVMGAIIVGDICGNSLVILSVCRHSKLRVTTNWFVVSLACADILVALFAMTFNASVIVSGRWLFKPWVCDFWNSCDVLASTASILHLCCISIDRYIAITRPLDYPMKITTRRVVYALCGVWISSALLSYIPIFTGVYTTAEHIKWLEDNPDQCDFVVNRVYAVVSSSISFWIPSSIMVFTYWRIYKEATRQEKFIYKAQSMMPAPMSNHHSSSSHSQAAKSKQRRSKSMAFSSSGPTGGAAHSSNEARIRQLARQQHELQPSAAATPSTCNRLAIGGPSSAAAIKQTSSSNQDLLPIESNIATTELSQPVSISDRASSLLQLAQRNDSSTGAPGGGGGGGAESEPLTAQPLNKTDINNNQIAKQQTVAKGPPPAGRRRPNGAKTTAFVDEEDEDEDDERDSNSGQSTPTKRSISKMKREHKAAKTLGIIMGVFILCWLPFFSWYTPQHLCGQACGEIVPRGAVTILFWIGYFNSTLNPIIYAYFNHEFRDAFKKTLQWIFCCCNDLKCLRVNRPNDNQHYNCTYRSTQEIGLVSNS